MKASGLFPTLCYLMSFMGYSLATGGTIPKPLVDSQSLRLRFNQTSLLERANYIESLTLGSLSKTRTFGDEAHIQTVEYIYTEAQKYGYNVWKQEVIGLYSVINELGIKAGDRTITPHGFYNSGSVKLWIKTELVVIHEEKGCNDMDYADAVNKTVLIDAGSPCGLGTKINTAVNMGVTAILFQSEHPEDPIGDKYPYWGELPPDFDFPVAAVTRSEGEWLTTWAKKGEMMELKLDYVKEERKTFDVFAQTTDGDQNNVVMLGANSDSPVMGKIRPCPESSILLTNSF